MTTFDPFTSSCGEKQVKVRMRTLLKYGDHSKGTYHNRLGEPGEKLRFLVAVVDAIDQGDLEHSTS